MKSKASRPVVGVLGHVWILNPIPWALLCVPVVSISQCGCQHDLGDVLFKTHVPGILRRGVLLTSPTVPLLSNTCLAFPALPCALKYYLSPQPRSAWPTRQAHQR